MTTQYLTIEKIEQLPNDRKKIYCCDKDGNKIVQEFSNNEWNKITPMKKQHFKGKEFIVNRGNVHPEYSYYTFEEEEKDLREKYWNIKENDVVFDIGASYGTYSLSAITMGATVYSFEPEPTVFCDLVKNININNWQTKCFAYEIGFWDSKTSIDMKSYAPHWPQQTITTPYLMDTIDNFVVEHKINKLDWMKIDVEGAEENVIRGALNTINKFKPNLFIECHVFLNSDILPNIKNLLKDLEYEFEEVNRDPCIMLIGKGKK